MPSIDNHVPLETLMRDTMLDAPIGALIYEFDGPSLLRGALPGLRDELNACIISLVDFTIAELDPVLDQNRDGLVAPVVSFRVNPASASAAVSSEYAAGDLISHGGKLAIAGYQHDGSVCSLPLNRYPAKGLATVYHEWQLGVLDGQGGFRLLHMHLRNEPQ